MDRFIGVAALQKRSLVGTTLNRYSIDSIYIWLLETYMFVRDGVIIREWMTNALYGIKQKSVVLCYVFKMFKQKLFYVRSCSNERAVKKNIKPLTLILSWFYPWVLIAIVDTIYKHLLRLLLTFAKKYSTLKVELVQAEFLFFKWIFWWIFLDFFLFSLCKCSIFTKNHCFWWKKVFCLELTDVKIRRIFPKSRILCTFYIRLPLDDFPFVNSHKSTRTQRSCENLSLLLLLLNQLVDLWKDLKWLL